MANNDEFASIKKYLRNSEKEKQQYTKEMNFPAH